MRTVLDTSVLLAAAAPSIDGELAISAASIAELHFGVLVTDKPEVRAERLRRLVTIQQRFDVLPIDEAVGASYGRLAAAVAASGRRPRSRVMDLLIAACAHAHKARICTRNAAELRGIEELVEIVPG